MGCLDVNQETPAEKRASCSSGLICRKDFRMVVPFCDSIFSKSFIRSKRFDFNAAITAVSMASRSSIFEASAAAKMQS